MDLEALAERSRSRRRLPEPNLRRLLREGARVSQEDLAQTLGVDRSTVCRWESGLRSPRDANLGAYLDVLDRLAAER
jgi:DNA-binding transcriptional regulator YiaG